MYEVYKQTKTGWQLEGSARSLALAEGILDSVDVGYIICANEIIMQKGF